MQEDYARADALSKEALELERREQEKANREINELLGDVF